jgi:hypothetical protein
MSVSVFNKPVFMLLLLLSIQLLAGCAPAISQQQFDIVQAELKSTKEQLAAAKAELASLKTQAVPVQKDQLEAPRKTLAALKPYLDLNLLILDEEITLSQQNTKAITVSYANMQYADQRNRLNDLVKKYEDKEFAGTVDLAWNESADAKLRMEAWIKTYVTLRDRLKANYDTLSKQLNP